MNAVRRYPREVIQTVLDQFGCRLVERFDAGFELWESGWAEPFTLYPDAEGGFSEDQFRAFMNFVSLTMPPDWTK
jgi:hypothetical protein